MSRRKVAEGVPARTRFLRDSARMKIRGSAMENEIKNLSLAARRGLFKSSWITVIDDRGFRCGQVLSTSSARRVLRRNGFKVRNNVAALQTKEWKEDREEE